MFLSRIRNLFEKEGIPFAIVGGYAVALHGAVRGTLDLDIITELTESNLMKMESALQSIGMVSSLPITASMVASNRENLIREKNLIAWNFYHSERKRDILDVLITEDIGNFSVVQIPSDFGNMPVIDFEGLINLKSKTKRVQDIEDVKALLDLQKKRKR
ncbi:MAG: hypothetical protein JJT78_04295 [Leptospira sp.]|nr:hypothetical protein [Leptospira sp.]